jgi:mRNA interferase RelE/StbE
VADLEYSERAAEWLRNADPDAQEQVLKKLEQAADFPSHFLKSLRGSPFYRVRAGDYRAIIDWQRNEDAVDVLFVRRIGHRDGIYD